MRLIILYNSGVNKTMNKKGLNYFFIILLMINSFMFSNIRVEYGGEVGIFLNEPSSLSPIISNYSNMIFYSLIYENFFYLTKDGNLFSNIFKDYVYNKEKKYVKFILKENLSFSNGDPIDSKIIVKSLKLFFSKKTLNSIKLSKLIKNINIDKNNIYINLIYNKDDIIYLFTAPELIVLNDSANGYSGAFFPLEWIKGDRIILKSNKYYSGGRPYIDKIVVYFNENLNYDIFISEPNNYFKQYNEIPSGVYQNIYLCFPESKIGKNTRIALFSLLKRFFKKYKNLTSLNSLTSDEESPVSISIKPFSLRKIKSILRYSRINLYIDSSLKNYERDLIDFLNNNKLKINTIFLLNNEIKNFLENTEIKYILVEKVFKKKDAIEEKIKRIIRELTFKRFSDEYLVRMNEIDELINMKNEDLLMDKIAEIVSELIEKGIILPLYQLRYSIYINKKLKGIQIGYYGRPFLNKLRLIKDEK